MSEIEVVDEVTPCTCCGSVDDGLFYVHEDENLCEQCMNEKYPDAVKIGERH